VIAFLQDSRGRNTAALIERDMRTGETKILAEDADAESCIVDIFEISNLLIFMRAAAPYWHTFFALLRQRIADPETEAGRAWLMARSPITFTDRIVRPLLIIQRMNDVRVKRAESEQIVDALKRRDIPVTYVTFSDEAHGFVREENRLAFSVVMEAFLAQHLGGVVEPVGDAFARSTIRLVAGRELIPGIPYRHQQA
jgi:Prolyl oligopeptidase family